MGALLASTAVHPCAAAPPEARGSVHGPADRALESSETEFRPELNLKPTVRACVRATVASLHYDADDVGARTIATCKGCSSTG